ncbi:MAG TPA: LacI family DNA-binding transcriptional regulator [Bryobacteraceae bacterium]|jgi:DNA-binding LacI/PurR family transcriptional regulator
MNLDEVAKLAGVSAATVSRVLNNLDVVRDATRDKVMRAVSELNYHPNLHARSLAGGKSRTIGMIASNLENPFFFDIFRTLEADSHAHGYEVVAAHTGYSPEQLVRSVRLMIGRRVAGLAVVVSEMAPDLIQELEMSRIPTVFYDVGSPKRYISNIRVQYRRGVEQVVELLDSLGHKRLAFVGHHSLLGPTSERQEAFVEAVKRVDPSTEWRTVADQDGPEGGRRAMAELLASGFRPTAVICVNDYTAIGVLRELRDRGLRVPEDVSVTGFDNIQLSEYCYPALTTVNIPRDKIGHLCFHELVPESAEAGNAGHEIVVEPELVMRRSVGPADPGRK